MDDVCGKGGEEVLCEEEVDASRKWDSSGCEHDFFSVEEHVDVVEALCVVWICVDGEELVEQVAV